MTGYLQHTDVAELGVKKWSPEYPIEAKIYNLMRYKVCPDPMNETSCTKMKAYNDDGQCVNVETYYLSKEDYEKCKYKTVEMQ